MEIALRLVYICQIFGLKMTYFLIEFSSFNYAGYHGIVWV